MKNRRPFVEVARDLAPLLEEFVSHEDCPVPVYNALLGVVEELENAETLPAKIGANFARWCEASAALEEFPVEVA